MVMIIIGITVGWVLCGILGYGMCYHSFQKKFNDLKTFELMGETWCRTAGKNISFSLFLEGPFGVLVSTICSSRPWGLQYRYKRPD